MTYPLTNMATEKIFIDGMRFELPNEVMREKAPWIKARIGIKVAELIPFLEKHQSNAGWVNIDLKKSENTGNMYLELNTFKKQEAPQVVKEAQNDVLSPIEYPEDVDTQEIPF